MAAFSNHDKKLDVAQMLHGTSLRALGKKLQLLSSYLTYMMVSYDVFQLESPAKDILQIDAFYSLKFENWLF